MNETREYDLIGRLQSHLSQVERVLKEQEWIVAGRFTIADLLTADILRVSKVRAFGEPCSTEPYVARLTGRPAFRKAHADQLARFASAGARRAAAG